MLAFLLLFGVGPIPVVPPKPAPPPLTGPIRDAAHLFSPTARQAAAERINELEKEHGYDLIVETIEEQPSTAELSGLLYQSARNAYLRDWAIKQAKAAGLKKGVYVVISKSPRDVRVVAYPAEVESKFTSVKLGRIRRKLQEHLESNPDRALAEGIGTFHQALEQVREWSSPLATVPLLIVIGSLVGFWIVLLILRRRVVPASEPLYPPAVQGSLFGAPAASWIYDRMYQAPPPAAVAAAPAGIQAAPMSALTTTLAEPPAEEKA